MDAALKRSFWEDDDLIELGKLARWVFAFCMSTCEVDGTLRLRRRKMALVLDMDWDTIDAELTRLASPPDGDTKGIRGAFIERVGDHVFVPGFMRQNLKSLERNTCADAAKLRWREHPDALRAVMIQHYPWLSDPTKKERSTHTQSEHPHTMGSSRGNSKSKGKSNRNSGGSGGSSDGPKPELGKPESVQGEGPEMPPKKNGADASEWLAFDQVEGVLRQVTGLTGSKAGLNFSPMLLEECRNRLHETGNDLPGVFRAVERRVSEIQKNAPGSPHLLTLNFLFREDQFGTMYELRDEPVRDRNSDTKKNDGGPIPAGGW
jgi:hypothetical protein